MITASTARLSPTCALTDLTTRSRSARSTFSIFIASTTASVSPALTSWPSAHRHGGEQARHGRQQELRRVGRGLDRHQRVQLGLARRQHQRTTGLTPPCESGAQPEPHGIDLHRDRAGHRPCRATAARPDATAESRFQAMPIGTPTSSGVAIERLAMRGHDSHGHRRAVQHHAVKTAVLGRAAPSSRALRRRAAMRPTARWRQRPHRGGRQVHAA